MSGDACRVCGSESTCACASMSEALAELRDRGADLLIVVDGSYNPMTPGRGGAGLVLVADNEIVAQCGAMLECWSAKRAELEAIVRADRWAPDVPIYSDCRDALRIAEREYGLSAQWIRREWRGPAYDMAHELANHARRARGHQEHLRRKEIALAKFRSASADSGTETVSRPGCTGMLKTIEMIITPEMATAWLEKTQVKNRAVNMKYVEYLVREIQSGNWKVTHQGIGFDDSDQLLDGQHRLMAIARAGRSVRMLVTHGVALEDSLRAVDQGKLRSRGQLLTMRGETYASQKAAVCAGLKFITDPDIAYGKSCGPADDVEMLERYREQIEIVVPRALKFSTRFMTIATLLYAALPGHGESFLSGIVTGENLGKGDPRLALRNLLGAVRSGGTPQAVLSLYSRCMSAAAAHVAGEPLAAVQVSWQRYVKFCEIAKIPINRSIFTFAGGTKMPDQHWLRPAVLTRRAGTVGATVSLQQVS